MIEFPRKCEMPKFEMGIPRCLLLSSPAFRAALVSHLLALTLLLSLLALLPGYIRVRGCRLQRCVCAAASARRRPLSPPPLTALALALSPFLNSPTDWGVSDIKWCKLHTQKKVVVVASRSQTSSEVNCRKLEENCLSFLLCCCCTTRKKIKFKLSFPTFFCCFCPTQKEW